MGLDMSVYATDGKTLTKKMLCEDDLNAWHWRKANSVHKWMVENVQNGVDDCEIYEVDINQLRELKDIVEEILASPEKAPDLLPTEFWILFR